MNEPFLSLTGGSHIFSDFPRIWFDHTGIIGAIITKVSLIWIIPPRLLNGAVLWRDAQWH